MRFLFTLFVALCCVLPSAWGRDMVMEAITVRSVKSEGRETMETREIRESNAVDPGEALDKTPGVTKLRKGGVANDIVIRGFKKDNINVLIDGSKLYGACPNKMDPPAFHVDFAEVKKIEVLKGPFDVRHQGSLGGLVDIRTRMPGPGLHARLNTSYGSFSETNISGAASYGTDRYSLLAGGAFRYAKPYKDGEGRRFTEIYPTGNPAGYKPSEFDATAYDIKTGWVKTRLEPAEGHEVSLGYTRQQADDVLYPYLVMDADKDTADRIHAAYSLDRAWAFRDIRVTGYGNLVDHDMSDRRRLSSSTVTSSPFKMQTTADTATWGGSLDSVVATTDTRIGVSGYARNWDAVTTMIAVMMGVETPSSQATMPDVDIANIGIYAEQEFRPYDSGLVTAGLRLDNTTSEAGIDRSSLYNAWNLSSDTDITDFAVSGFLKYDHRFTDGLQAFAAIGRSVRVPDPEERFFALKGMTMGGMQVKPDRVGNPGLDPVVNREVDTGIRYSAAEGRVLLKAQLFYSDLRHYIVVRDLQSGSGMALKRARTYVNVDASIYGGEAAAEVALPANLFASLSLSYSRGRNDTDDTDLQEMPPMRAVTGLRWDNGMVFCDVEGIFAAQQDKVDDVIGEQETPAWQVFNLKTGFEKDRFRLMAGVKNIFDQSYEEHLSYFRDPFASGIRVPEPGRSYYVNLAYRF